MARRPSSPAVRVVRSVEAIASRLPTRPAADANPDHRPEREGRASSADVTRAAATVATFRGERLAYEGGARVPRRERERVATGGGARRQRRTKQGPRKARRIPRCPC